MSIRTIISERGGATRIAEKSRELYPDRPDRHVAEPTVYKWPNNGIPEARWPVLKAIKPITEAELHAANEAVRTKKKGSEMQSEAHAA